MPGSLSDVEKEIRKLRKRLRQIENLERQEFEGRELSEDEENKVLKKNETRIRLQQFLVQFAQEIEGSEDLSEYGESFGGSADVVQPVTSVVKSTPRAQSTPRPQARPALRHTVPQPTAGGSDADNEWRTVGEKKQNTSSTPARPEKATEQAQNQPMTDPVKKNPDKRTAGDPSQTKYEPQPPKKQRKETAPVVKVSETERRRNEARLRWSNRAFTVLTLEGHNDLVSAVHLDRDWLLSGSRDTTLKVWNVKNGFEEKNFGGHSDAVTALILLSEYATQRLAETYELGQHERLIVSGSQDCSLKIWALNQGTMCRSVYTYNPVTALAYLDTPGLIVAGSGGGKVELWEPHTGNGLQSLIAHQDAVTKLTAEGSMVYSGSVDGIIKVYQLRDLELHVVHESDDVTCASGSPLLLRHIRSMAASHDMVYYGDDGNNIKVLDWKKGEVHKLKNHHTGDFGSTDAMCCYDNLLLTSGYDLDHGVGYINVWTLPEEDYMTTLRDESLSRIMCLSCARPASDQVMIATGGFSLQLWLPNTQKREGDVSVRAEYVAEYSNVPEDSDVESEGEVSDSDAEQATSFFWRSNSRKPKGTIQVAELEEKGWFSWCEIL